MITKINRRDLVGRYVYDIDGQFVGQIADTWPLDGGGLPEMILVKVGRRFGRPRYLPLKGVRVTDIAVIVPWELWRIDDAPAADDKRWGDPALIARSHWLLCDDD